MTRRAASAVELKLLTDMPGHIYMFPITRAKLLIPDGAQDGSQLKCNWCNSYIFDNTFWRRTFAW